MYMYMYIHCTCTPHHSYAHTYLHAGFEVLCEEPVVGSQAELQVGTALLGPGAQHQEQGVHDVVLGLRTHRPTAIDVLPQSGHGHLEGGGQQVDTGTVQSHIYNHVCCSQPTKAVILTLICPCANFQVVYDTFSVLPNSRYGQFCVA